MDSATTAYLGVVIMRVWAVLLVGAVLGLSACSLQLPAGNDVEEPFFQSTYDD